jgi:hypothetical protein
MTIRTSFHWGAVESDGVKSSYKMAFEIQDSRRDWLVSGRRKGEFTATVCVIPFLDVKMY